MKQRTRRIRRIREGSAPSREVLRAPNGLHEVRGPEGAEIRLRGSTSGESGPMRPVLVSVGTLDVGAHDFFVLLGVAVATAVFMLEAKRRRVLGEDLLWVVVGSLFCGAVFAKAGGFWNLVADSGGPDSTAEVIARGGRTILGGLAGAYIGAVATKRIVGYRAKTGDLFAPAVALGMAVGRFGCYVADDVGGSTMHPSFIYEIAFHAVAFVVLMRNRDRI